MVDKAEAWSPFYPFEPKRKELSCGHSMSYIDEGEGHPVIMVHGNPTWSFYYRNVVLGLRDRYRCIAVDHIGCGLSDKPSASDYAYTLEQRIKDLGELIDSLGLERFDLVVHDWGGAIGIGMALKRIEKLRRLAILNTAAFTDSRIPNRIALCRAPIIGRLIVQGLNGFAWPASWMSVSKGSLDRKVKAGLLYPYSSWSNRRAVYQFVKDIPMNSKHRSYGTLRKIEEGLSKLQSKGVTLLWGGKDFCFNDHFLNRWKSILPEATVIRFPEGGHYILEDETEKVVTAIDQLVSYDDEDWS